jgi:hypothetical protein
VEIRRQHWPSSKEKENYRACGGLFKNIKIQEYPTLQKFCDKKGQFNHTTPRQI